MSAIESLMRGHIRDCREKIAEAVRSVDALEQLVKKVAAMPLTAQPTTRTGVNGWSEEERELLIQFYPSAGPIECAKMLPHRTRDAIITYATRKLGLTYAHHLLKTWCEQCEAKVTQQQQATCGSPFCPSRHLGGE